MRHQTTIVIVPPDVELTYPVVGAQLRKHIVGPRIAGNPTIRFDTWKPGPESLGGCSDLSTYRVTPNLHKHVCVVSDLPQDFYPDVVVFPDGSLLEQPARCAEDSLWRSSLQRLLAPYTDHLAVSVTLVSAERHPAA